MNRRNILLYTLAGIFAILGALANGISPFIVGIPAAEKAVSLGEALILAAIGVLAAVAASQTKREKISTKLTEKAIPALLCAMAVFILADAAVCIPHFSGLTSSVRIAGDIINAAGFVTCGAVMLRNRREKSAALYIILSALSGSAAPIMLTAAWLALTYNEERERSRRKARNGLIAAFFVILATYAAVYITLGQETVRNIGLSDLYMRLMAALFIAVIAVFAFLPSSKYKRPDGEK